MFALCYCMWFAATCDQNINGCQHECSDAAMAASLGASAAAEGEVRCIGCDICGYSPPSAAAAATAASDVDEDRGCSRQ